MKLLRYTLVILLAYLAISLTAARIFVANLENNFLKLGIDIEKDYPNIISGVNILRLSNNPIELKKEDLKKIINDAGK